MKKILFVNHVEKNCGVQQYGKRVASIFQKNTKKYTAFYLESGDLPTFIDKINEVQPSIIIYNYLPETMPWFHIDVAHQLRQYGVKQGLIVHNIGYAHFFDFYLHQIPNYPENGNNYSLLRPLLIYNKPEIKKDDGKIKIGSFGFGFKTKKWENICQLVNDQFNEEVDLRLHLTLSHFIPNAKELEEVKIECLSRIKKPNIHLTFTKDFLDDDALLDFLASNDLNIYLYKNYDVYNGISCVTDYFLSVKKPLAINKSNMFSHISNAQPSVCVEDNSLKRIIKNGFSPLEPYYNAWNNNNFTIHLESIFDKL